MPLNDDIGAYSVDQFAHIFGLSRSAVYAEIRSGRLRVSKVGTRTVITRRQARDYQTLLEQEAESPCRPRCGTRRWWPMRSRPIGVMGMNEESAGARFLEGQLCDRSKSGKPASPGARRFASIEGQGRHGSRREREVGSAPALPTSPQAGVDRILARGERDRPGGGLSHTYYPGAIGPRRAKNETK